MSIIEQSEILRRRDMRDVFTFTIDPADAKDFDDALSFAVVNDEDQSPITNHQSPIFQIGVHIADVSFYVRPNTKVDDDAYKRGTSVYLVDRVLPMLPEELCNDKCSLRPNEDKLCMSVVFTMDADARVIYAARKSKGSPAVRGGFFCLFLKRAEKRAAVADDRPVIRGVVVPYRRKSLAEGTAPVINCAVHQKRTHAISLVDHPLNPSMYLTPL